MTRIERIEGLYSPEPTSGCWLWTGVLDRKGYGRLRKGPVRGRWEAAHRAAWAEFRGPIPAGALVLHRCDNPTCINPDHLYLGTDGDNMRDRARRRRNPMQRDSVFYRPEYATVVDHALLARGVVRRKA